MNSDTSIRPILIAALGVVLFAVFDAMMKVIASTYPLAQSTGMRYCAGAIAATAFYLFTNRPPISKQAIVRAIPRSVITLLAGTCLFFAVSRLPLVDAITLTFLSPLFMALWGWLFLKERLSKGALAAMSVGFLGVYLMALGHSSNENKPFDLLGFCAAIANAAMYALSMVMTRRHSSKDTLPILVLLPAVIGAAISAPTMVMSWQPVIAWHYLLLVCLGIVGTAALICVSWAYSNSHVNRLGLLDYTGLVWALLFGYFIFHEVPSLWTLAGALLIVGACITAFF